jgi:hypothetical protein
LLPSLCSAGGSALLHRFQASFRKSIEQTSVQVNARLQVVIKNGDMIKIINLTASEGSALRQIKEESDETRKADAKLKFIYEIIRKNLYGIFPCS